ncbi:hypothetical protein APA_378 [Pseudanabaena sp. lw0831]|nr:hypothetical protein APA_378 [Pseudanabaena sp. lw0831]
MPNKLPKPVKLRPCGAQLYGFGCVSVKMYQKLSAPISTKN